MPRPCVLILLAFFATITTSESLAEGYPLFNSDDTIVLVLDVPMRTLLRQAKKKPVLEGRLHYADTDGAEVSIDITITTRGKSRLELCAFPPLSITLNTDQTGSTLFAGQRKLKIVTHCRNSLKNRRYLHQEFGIYKAYNLLSDYSFRARMLEITYQDSEQKRRDEVVPAFFIESDDEVAERNGMTKIKSKTIKTHQFNASETNIYELFQYMIANTDWAIKKGPRTENCCHNGKVIGKPDADVNWGVLPYDFDQAGIINTDYALPAIGLGIRTVRQRLYRGRCRHNDRLPETIRLFNERRSELETAIVPKAMSDRSQRSALNYVGVFFETINDSEKLNKKLIGVCRAG